MVFFFFSLYSYIFVLLSRSFLFTCFFLLIADVKMEEMLVWPTYLMPGKFEDAEDFVEFGKRAVP